MKWHYQVMKRTEEFAGEKYITYGIYEYYPSIGGKTAWTVDPIESAETLEDLKNSILMMLDDFDVYGVKDYDD